MCGTFIFDQSPEPEIVCRGEDTKYEFVHPYMAFQKRTVKPQNDSFIHPQKGNPHAQSMEWLLGGCFFGR